VKPLRRLLIPALILPLLAAACSDSSDAAQDPANAAKVGSTVITTGQLTGEVKIFKFIAAINGSQCGASAPAGATTAPAFDAAGCNRQALGYLIQSVYVDRYATDNKVTAPDADVTKAVQQLDAQLGAPKIDAALKANGLTRTDLTALAHQFVLSSNVRTAVETSAVTDTQLKAMYRQQIASFTTVDLDHIVLKTKAEADKIYSQVTAPGFTQKDFEALATKVSTDPGASTNHGHYTQTVGAPPGAQSGGFVKEFADAVLALKPGETSKPVQTSFGWHVILLNSKTVTPFSDAKAGLLQVAGGSAFQEWLTAQDKTSPVTVNPKYGTYDPARGVIPITSTGSVSPTVAPTVSPAAPTAAGSSGS
jgi:parvulin-like peptidyl-prolyl isomerase